MIPVHLRPNNLGGEIFNDDELFATTLRIFSERISNLAQYLDEFFLQQQQPDPPRDNILHLLYDEWKDFFLDHLGIMFETHTFQLYDDSEGEEAGDEESLYKVRHTFGLQVWVELSRLNYLCQFHIKQSVLGAHELENIISLESETEHPSWISIVKTFDISGQYEKDEEKDEEVEERHALIREVWRKPFMTYRQSEVVLMVLFLSQQVNSLEASCVEEFRMVFEFMWLRSTELLVAEYNGDILDEEDMRMPIGEEVEEEAQEGQKATRYMVTRVFSAFLSFYLGLILKRLDWYDIMSKNKKRDMARFLPNNHIPLAQLSQNMEAWIAHIVMEMPDEAFEDLHVETCVDSYSFPGDDLWFVYRWPLKVHSRQACLAQLRPHLYRRYFAEGRTSKGILLDQLKRGSYAARLFVLRVISDHLSMHHQEMKWFDGIVILAEDITASTYKLESNMAPLIVQCLSSFWVYDDTSVFKTDDFYLTLGLWFFLLQTRYSSSLHGYSLLKFLPETIERHLYKKPEGQQSADKEKRKKKTRIRF